MAFDLHRPGHQQSLIAASVILPRQPIKLAGTSTLFALPAATNADRPFGMNGPATAGASGLNQGETLTVLEELNIVKAIAGASMGVGNEVFVGSSNGVLMPALAASLFSASGHWVVGVNETPASAAGDVISVFVKPRKA